MTTTAQSVIKTVGILLNDETNVRWTAGELVTWLNAGQREIVINRPDATAKVANATLAQGTRQQLTAIAETTDAYKLMDITRNVAVSSLKRVVRLTSRELMDAQFPDWHTETQSVDIVHYMFDPRVPTQFYVYPPAATGAQVEVTYSAYPVDVATPSGSGYATVSGNIGVSDIYVSALTDYILYRAYLKDGDAGGSAEKVAGYYSAFANALGMELKGTVSVGPTTNQNATTPTN